MSFGIGVGGFLQGLLEARQRAQQQAVQQQQLSMQQQAQQAEQDYRNKSLQQQRDESATNADYQNRDLAERGRLADNSAAQRQIEHFEGIVYGQDFNKQYTPEMQEAMRAKLNHLYDLNPAFDPRPSVSQGQHPDHLASVGPQTPQTMFGPQAGPQQMNQPQAPATAPAGGVGGAAQGASPQVGPPGLQAAQPSAAPGQGQAPVDPTIAGIDRTINHYETLLHSGALTGAQEDEAYGNLSKLYAGRLAAKQGLASLAGQETENKYAGPKAEAQIGVENAQKNALNTETALKPEEAKNRALQARATVIKAMAELQRIQRQGQPTPADKIRAAELEHKINQDKIAADHWNKEYQRQTGNDAFGQFKSNYELSQKDQELGQKEPQAATQARAAKIKILMNSALDPITKALDLKKVPALLSGVDRLSQQTGSPVGIEELNPPGINSDVWNAVNQPGFDPHKAIAYWMKIGRQDLAGQAKTAMGIAGRMQGHLQKSGASMQRPATSLTDPLGLQNNP